MQAKGKKSLNTFLFKEGRGFFRAGFQKKLQIAGQNQQNSDLPRNEDKRWKERK